MAYTSPWGQTYYQPWEQQQPAAQEAPKEKWPGELSGFPAPPEYQSILGSDGNLLSQYQLQAQPDVASYMPQFQQYFDQSRGALDRLSDYANGPTGSSPWAMAQLNDLQNQTGQAYGKVGDQVGAATATAYDSAASRGGLSSAMRASLARNAQRLGVQGRQGVAGQSIDARNKIMTGDADRQLSALAQLPGMENSRLGLWGTAASANQQNDQNNQRVRTLANQFNVQNAIGGRQGQNQYNMDMYEQGIKRAAGSEMADATANSGKK